MDFKMPFEWSIKSDERAVLPSDESLDNSKTNAKSKITSRSPLGTGTSLLSNIYPCVKRNIFLPFLNSWITKIVLIKCKIALLLGIVAVVSSAYRAVTNLSDGRKDWNVRERERFNFDWHVLSINEDHFQRLYRVTRSQLNKICTLKYPKISGQV